MIQRILAIAVFAGAVYWYWSGPYQARVNPTYQQQLKKNNEEMAGCIRAEAFQLGATGRGLGEEQARQMCAKKFNVYEEDGNWHSYDALRD